MKILLKEGRFEFVFKHHLAAIKLDEVEGYTNYEKNINRFRQGLSKPDKDQTAGNKDIDFVCANKDNDLHLIEVKDYLGGGKRKGLLENLAKFNDENVKGYLPKEVAVKVIDTILALTVVLSEEQDKNSVAIKKAFSEFIANANKNFRIVLWLFYDKTTLDVRREQAQLHAVKDKLAKNLRFLGSGNRIRMDVDHSTSLGNRYNIDTTLL